MLTYEKVFLLYLETQLYISKYIYYLFAKGMVKILLSYQLLAATQSFKKYKNRTITNVFGFGNEQFDVGELFGFL